MSGFHGIERLIKKKESEIQKRTNSGIHEHVNFKKLHASLSTYKDKRPVSGFIFIIIKNDSIEGLNSSDVKILYNSIDTCISEAKNHLIIDHNYKILSTGRIDYGNSTATVRSICIELSKDNFSVFVLNSISVNYFINGDEKGELIFYTKEDQERFHLRKDITELNQLFDDYRLHLQNRDIYQKFFVSNSGKISLLYHLMNNKKIESPDNTKDKKKLEKKFLEENKRLLQNKPEDRFREDLRAYLSKNLKGTIYISKEYILESFKRIDIFINDEFGDLYLLEVKWVGLSIHQSGTRLGTEIKANKINPEAVRQTVNYIYELHNHKKHIKLGYLVVFDARKDEEGTEDTLSNFDITTLDQKSSSFYSRFKKISDFKVDNYHPN